MRRLLLPLVLLLPLAITACAPALPARGPEAAATAPGPGAPPSATPPGDPFAITGSVREEWMPLLKLPVIDPAKTRLLSPPAGLSPPSAACAAHAARKGEGRARCADPAAALAALDGALAVTEVEKRDAALADLEACAGLPAGVARALRAELLPMECGEALAEPFLKAPPAGMNGLVYHALLGQAVASRLSRAAHDPPQLALPHDRQRVLEFVKGPMRAWFEEQSRAIEEVSAAAAELPYDGKGIAAIEAGIADLRLVEAVRSAPIPDEFARENPRGMY